MKALRALLEELSRPGGPGVLATLVRVKGSSYRQPGARMLLGPEGPRLGAVSGGCLETDLLERVKGVLEAGRPQLVKYDMGSDLDLLWGTGMGCEGVAEVLLEPVQGKVHPWIPFTAQMLAKRRRGVLATVFAAEGEVPCAVGEHYVLDEGLHGLMPADQRLSMALSDAARELAASLGASGREPRAQSAVLELPGGKVELCLEPLLPPYALWIFNAGETARPLADLASRLGWEVGVADHRPALATRERFPSADHVRVGEPSRLALPLDERSATVVMSHVFAKDKEALVAFLASKAAYVGLQGNRTRCARILRELEAEGLGPTEAQKARLYHPVGLDLGAESPESIALSILAEIHAVLAGHEAGHLREGAGAIHG